MLVRFGCLVLLTIAAFAPQAARADCAQQVSQLMSKDTEKLTTRYQRVTKQIKQSGASPKLIAEECRIARQLQPKLESQLAALKQSGCVKDPQVSGMIADIVRGHEDDLELARRSSSRSECR